MAEKQGKGKGKRSRKHFTRKNTPCQQRYVLENRRDKNKTRRAQAYANRFNTNVVISTKFGPVVIKPKG